MPIVTVEQAACTALRTWLASQLTDVQVRDSWPDDDRPLPGRAITVLLVGRASDEWTSPTVVGHENIHATIPPALGVTLASIVDVPTANAALNTIRTAYETHRVSLTAHQAADATNAVTAPAVVDLTSVPQGLALGADLLAKIAAHAGNRTAHAAPDEKNVPTLASTNSATLIAQAKHLAETLSAHFATRLYTWMLGVRQQPVQVDVWATSEAGREELLHRFEQALRRGAAEATPRDVFDQDYPVGMSLGVRLGDNWAGSADHRAVFEFESADRGPDDPQSQEWRAMYLGTLDAPLLAKAQSPRLARIRIETTLGEVAGPTLTVDSATALITPG